MDACVCVYVSMCNKKDHEIDPFKVLRKERFRKKVRYRQKSKRC